MTDGNGSRRFSAAGDATFTYSGAPETVSHWSDPVKAPGHYQWINGIECKDVVQHFQFFDGCALKYIWRAGRKLGETRLEALLKAQESLQNAIRHERERLSGTSPF